MNSYYIGDPCYVLNSDLFEHIINNEKEVEIGEHTILFNHTDHGDGVYDLLCTSTLKCIKSLPVDSGTLSVIPMKLLDSPVNLKLKDGTQYVPRTHMGAVLIMPGTMSVNEGVFTFGGMYTCNTYGRAW